MTLDYRDYWNPEMETISDTALFDLHQERFLKQIQYVFQHTPFYQEKYGQAGLTPADIHGLDDIIKLPFTEKAELRVSQMKHPPVGSHRACTVEKLSRVYSSSGTTGIPTYIGLTAYDIHSVQAEAIARFCWSGGIRPGSRVINVPTAPFIADTFREGIEKTGAVHIPTGFNVDRVISALQYQDVDSLQATVSFWTYLLEEVERRGLNPRELGLRRILGGGEGGARLIRSMIEERFNTIVIEGMGMGEMTCLLFGECIPNRGNGMHYLTQGLVHIELIDPETGAAKEIKEDAVGELVLTALQSEAMPLMRYRTRDHVRIVSTEPCVCGRTGFRIEMLGRTDDMMTILGVNVYPLAIRDVISTLKPRVSGEIEIQLDKPGPVVTPPLTIKVEVGKEPGNRDELRDQLARLLRDKLIFRAHIELVDALPKYQYKRKLINKLYE